MTYSHTPDDGTTWDYLREPESTPANLTGRTSSATWGIDGWYPDGYPDGTPPACQVYSGEPTLVGNVATWPVPGNCADLQREDYQRQINGQVDDYKPLDDDAEGLQQDRARKALLKTIELDDTADEDLDNFVPSLDGVVLDGEYVANVQALQIQDRLAVDDQLVAVGDAEAYTSAERSAVEVSLSETLDARRQNVRPPTPDGAVREAVRVPDETVDQMLAERMEWINPPEIFPGHFITATLLSDDAAEAAEARLSVFTEAGGSLGVYPFDDNGDGTWTLSTQSSEGQRTADPRLLRYELLWGSGSLSVIRRQTLTVDQQGREHSVRYGAPTNGVAASRHGR